MQTIDISIIILFFLFTLGLGFYHGKKTRDSQEKNDFFLAGKSIPWFVLSVSLVATETSTLTFLGVPALSYKGDFSFLSLAIGFILGRILSALFLLPLYSSGKYTSIYEWVGEVLGSSSQKTLSFLFSLIRIFADGVRLYAASLPLSFLLYFYFPEDWSFNQISVISLVILSIATVLYSAYGGFRAVVWTDFLQFFVYGLGGFFVLYLLWQEFGSPLGLSREKLTLFHLDMRMPNGNWDPYYIWFSIGGGILLSLGSHGTDQMIVQRLLACKNLRSSQLALVTSGVLVFFQFFLFLAIGSYLVLKIPNSETANRVFSDYIVNYLPSPLKGFILAGVFASSMSTLSSTLNSLTLTTKIDWNLESRDLGKYFFIFRKTGVLTVLWGIILLFASTVPFLLDEKAKASIVELGLSFASFVFGAMISIFLLGAVMDRYADRFLLFRYSKQKSIFPFVLILSIVLCFAIHLFFLPPFTWLVAIGIISFFFVLAISYILLRIQDPTWEKK